MLKKARDFDNKHRDSKVVVKVDFVVEKGPINNGWGDF